jgi:hypothetical protein
LRKILVLVLATAVAAIAAAPAHADKPLQLPTLVLNNVVTGQTACGELRWDIHLVVEQDELLRHEGNLVRQIALVKEDNTITNLTTGETFREGPDSFTQTIYFNPDRTIDRLIATGLQVRVGNELIDAGRVVLEPLGGGKFNLVFSAGQHPVREAADDSTITDALSAFCAVFE